MVSNLPCGRTYPPVIFIERISLFYVALGVYDMMNLPEEVLVLLEQLNNAGHSAYVVGGCVRDSLLGDRKSVV